MKSLTLQEHEWLGFGQSGSITEADAQDLEQLATKLPSDCLEWGHNRLKFTNYCGVIQCGELLIEILPKVDDQSTPSTERATLINMLQAVGHLGGDSLGSATLTTQSHHLLDTFILDFCRRTQSLLVRGGPIQRYREIEEDLPTVRGRIDLTYQLRQNAMRQHVIHCRHEIRSIDNEYNQAILTTLTLLAKIATGQAAKRAVNELRLPYDGVTTRPMSPQAVWSLEPDRTISAWRPIVRQCAWFLTGHFPQLAAGQNESLALLFAMPRLFEQYLGRAIRQSRAFKHCQVVEQKAPRHLASDSNGRPAFSLQPDIRVLDHHKKTRVIIDAKWKATDENANKINVHRNDAYQMAVYAAAYECDQVVLAYPSNHTTTTDLSTRYSVSRPCTVLHAAALPVNSLAGTREAVDRLFESNFSGIQPPTRESRGRGTTIGREALLS